MYGHFGYLMMHFDLINVAALLMKLMNDIFCPYIDKSVIVFLDDILIYSKTLSDHRHHLQ